ncbi:MAG: phosphoribosylformimino-5-aminoimidazole carboxamide ribotide isomerase [Lachnospiraceae bacterium]|nr:phosphoribosylformimino-5-aminoimidazole carboxamide ribotide isomerase [Candidatus Merdinaster equi]
MEFRPCIDIHNGQVKQIVGGTLSDQGDMATVNFASARGAAYYAELFREKKLSGGHVILLNSKDSPYYEATWGQAISALKAYPKGLQVGGGICPENAEEFLKAGADKVIVTSYVFSDGKINMDNLEKLEKTVGKENLTLDLSCRKTEEGYKIVTDRWQKMTDVIVNKETIDLLSEHASELLVHAVDVEGKGSGVEEEVLKVLGAYCKIPVTYAGGVHDYEDLYKIYRFGAGKINVTVGSALDIYGGLLSMQRIIDSVVGLNQRDIR